MSATATMERVKSLRVIMLNPLEVQHGWDVLFFSLWESGMFPKMENVSLLLHDAMCEKLQIWILRTENEEGQPVLVGVVCTKIFHSPYTGETGFTLQHAHVADAYVTAEAWATVYKELFKYAKKRNCTFAEIYSENPRAQQLLKMLGFTATGAFRRKL
jgi:hypothetical protein